MARAAGTARWVGFGLASLAASIAVVVELGKIPPAEVDFNMLFVPPRALVQGLASGYENVAADGLWLGLIQYYGDRVMMKYDDRKFENLEPMLDLITDLDPRFYFAYWLGGWALGDNGQSAAALKLLEKGERLNPNDYQYPYLEGFIDFLFDKNYARAAKDFQRAADMPNAERFARTMAARMLQKQGLDEQALSIWTSLYQHAPDKATRDIAKHNVERIQDEIAGKRKRAYNVTPERPSPAPGKQSTAH